MRDLTLEIQKLETTPSVILFNIQGLDEVMDGNIGFGALVPLTSSY